MFNISVTPVLYNGRAVTGWELAQVTTSLKGVPNPIRILDVNQKNTFFLC